MIVRFLGDSVGYRVPDKLPMTKWVSAKMDNGSQTVTVKINMDQAYLMEEGGDA